MSEENALLSCPGQQHLLFVGWWASVMLWSQGQTASVGKAQHAAQQMLGHIMVFWALSWMNKS